MKGYLAIPAFIDCECCKCCGSRPVIVQAGMRGYVVKCLADDAHYQTRPGLIDIEDWNVHNAVLNDDGSKLSDTINGR